MTHFVEQSGCAEHPFDQANDAECRTEKTDRLAQRGGERACATGRSRSRHGRDNPDGGPNTTCKGARRSRWTRTLSLKVLASEYVWLWDVRHGISTKEIAIREGVSVRRVRFGVGRARAQERGRPSEAASQPPRLIPLFPIGSYVPQSVCGHRQPIEPGSLFYCVVCHSSGIDGHPALNRDPLTDPAPEPKPAPALAPKKTGRETRKQRRQREFAGLAVSAIA
jgi:hypothetical protein